jgi:exoribonuclease R
MLTKQLVGVLELSSKYRYGLTSRGAPLYLFRPYDETEPEYAVGSSERDTSRNQIVLVDVPVAEAADGSKPRGTLVRTFGPVGDYQSEREALLKHYCPDRQQRPTAADLEVDTSDDGERTLLAASTGWTTFHIDPPGCRDVDDAIGYHTETRTWAIVIADAAAYVPVDSAVDIAAEAIGATFYDSNGAVQRPMLPISISEERASLLPGARRRGVALFVPPADGSEKPHFGLVWIEVATSMTYDSWPTSALAASLDAPRDAHTWIEELMVRYNQKAAVVLKSYAAGLLRTQRAPDAQAVESWRSVAPELAHMANEAAAYEFACEDADQSHAGLGLPAYCHASSPLRRYADLVNQRILKALLLGKPLPPVEGGLAAHLNERTRANRRWGRDLHFLNTVRPGRVQLVEVIYVGNGRVWVPTWRRLLRLRHPAPEGVAVGGQFVIQVFCDPTRRNWRQRVLTAAAT